MTNRLPLFLLLILCALSVVSYVNAYETQVWWTEFLTAAIPTTAFALTYKKFRFSNIGYCIFFAWCVLQLIGAQYTFERVPFDAITNFFGFERNHYDRLAHFTVGCSAFLFCEFVYRKCLVSGKFMASLFGVISVMALANAWELIEWIYAEIDGGSAGLAFLGSQGDIWDAQKDMLMDTLGAICASILFYFCAGKPSTRLIAQNKQKTY